jgi:hypothetical protein
MLSVIATAVMAIQADNSVIVAATSPCRPQGRDQHQCQRECSTQAPDRNRQDAERNPRTRAQRWDFHRARRAR